MIRDQQSRVVRSNILPFKKPVRFITFTDSFCLEINFKLILSGHRLMIKNTINHLSP